MERKVLVTGADGFIGSHLVEALVLNGFSVRAFVLYNSLGSWGWLDRCDPNVIDEVEIFPGDIRDMYCVNRAVSGCDIVFHLAALIAIPYSYQSPESYVDTNVTGTLNVLQAVRSSNVQRMVHTSTSEVYGSARFVPITEDHPLQGQSPYSATKIAADQLVQAFYCSFDTPVTTVRPFNTYGPRQSARAIIPTIITQLVNGQNEVKLGSTLPTRDFNFVSDTVKGFMCAGISSSVEGEVINVGSGFELSIGEVAQIIAEEVGVEMKITEDPCRLRPKESEVERLLADNSKARALLNWSPEFADVVGFRRGIRLTVDWFTDPQNLALYKANSYNV
jgi:NAD dependent epimerase/dehydratase